MIKRMFVCWQKIGILCFIVLNWFIIHSHYLFSYHLKCCNYMVFTLLDSLSCFWILRLNESALFACGYDTRRIREYLIGSKTFMGFKIKIAICISSHNNVVFRKIFYKLLKFWFEWFDFGWIFRCFRI